MKTPTRREVIAATFKAIAAAEGWDRECPIDELTASVEARLKPLSSEKIVSFDDDLRKVLTPSLDVMHEFEDGECVYCGKSARVVGRDEACPEA